MSEKKKQDVAEQITDICQEFVALFTDFFLSSWCHLKKLVIRQCALYLRLLIEAWDLTEDLLKKGTF